MNTASRPAPRRVVITGVGLVSPLGCTPTEYAAALAEGRSGVTLRADGNAEAIPQVGGFASGFSGAISDFGDLEGPQKKAIRKGLKLMCRETQMAVAAAQHALADADSPAEDDPERTGVVLGSDYMLTLPDDYLDAIAQCTDGDAGGFDYDRWGGDGLAAMNPLWMLRYLPNMPASHIAIYNDLRGPNNSLTMREAGGLMAVGEALRIIARGDAERMIAGATGTRVLPMQAIHAQQQGALGDALEPPVVELGPGEADPAKLSRPFDRDRRGMVCGEGAGMVVLESAESAAARGAKVYGELVGFGASTVVDKRGAADGLVGRNDVAIANALRAALRDAGLEPSAVGHVNADGLGAPQADRDEAAALRAALGDLIGSIPVVALKSYFGNLGAGSGVVELIGSLLAYDPSSSLAGALPRTLNHETTDPECPLGLTAAGAAPGDAFLALNATPQGQAAAVAVARYGG